MSVFFINGRQPTPDEQRTQHQLEHAITEAVCQIGPLLNASPLQVAGAMLTIGARGMAAVIDLDKRATGRASSISAFTAELDTGLEYRNAEEVAKQHPLWNTEAAGRA